MASTGPSQGELTSAERFCGISGALGALPSDPSGAVSLQAQVVLGGIKVSWGLPPVNGQAVAHTRVYAGNGPGASALVTTTGASNWTEGVGNGVTRYYWIEQVSINGTVGPRIGPVSATMHAQGTVGQMLDFLAGQIDASMLAQSLLAPIQDIARIETAVLTENYNRTQSIAEIGARLAALGIDIDAANALVIDERTTRLTESEAFANQITGVVATLEGNAAVILEERTARVDALEAVATELLTLNAAFAGNEAAILEERTVRSDAVSAEAARIDSLYVSVDQANASILDEANARATAISAEASRTTALQGVVGANAAAIVTERDLRVSEQGALATQINTVAAGVTKTFRQGFAPPAPNPAGSIWYDTNNGNKPYRWEAPNWVLIRDGEIAEAFAAVVSEQLARTNADGALAADITTLEARANGVSGEISSRIQDYNYASVGYCLINGVPSEHRETRAECEQAGGEWIAMGAIARAVKGVQISDGAQSAKIEQVMAAHRNDLGDLLAEYTVKVESGDLVGGFGLTNDGITVEAGFNVDKFWIGRPGTPKNGGTGNYPFVIDNGKVYMRSAYIQDLTVDTIKILDGAISRTVDYAGPNRSTFFHSSGWNSQPAFTFTMPWTGQTSEIPLQLQVSFAYKFTPKASADLAIYTDDFETIGLEYRIRTVLDPTNKFISIYNGWSGWNITTLDNQLAPIAIIKDYIFLFGTYHGQTVRNFPPKTQIQVRMRNDKFGPIERYHLANRQIWEKGEMATLRMTMGTVIR